MVDAPKVFKHLTLCAERIRDNGKSSDDFSNFNKAVDTAVKQIRRLGVKFVAKMPHVISEGIQAITIISPTLKANSNPDTTEKKEFIANSIILMKNISEIIDEMASHEKEAVSSILPIGILNIELQQGMFDSEPKKVKDLFKL